MLSIKGRVKKKKAEAGGLKAQARLVYIGRPKNCGEVLFSGTMCLSSIFKKSCMFYL